MDTKQYIWSIVQTALIFAAIGAILTLSIPAIATALGIAGESAGFQALFFGGFGILSAGITPLVNQFWKKSTADTPDAENEKEAPVHSTVHSRSAPQQGKTVETSAVSDLEPEMQASDNKFRSVEAARIAGKVAHAGTMQM